MANVIEYTLSLNDRVTGKLNKINITNSKALEVWAKVEQRVNSANSTMQKCGVSLGSLRERVDALRAEREWIPASNINAIRRTNIEVKALERQIRQLERVNGGKIKTMLSDAFNSIPFANTLTNPIVMAGMAGFKALETGFEREKVQVAFDVLLRGDTKASEALREEIRQYGMITPYMTADLQEAAKMMLSFGIAQDKIMPNMKALGDIAMGDKNKLNSLTLAFSQMTSAGKLSGEDLLQMINAGFNPLSEISRKTGKSIGVLKDEMSKGKISADMVTQAFYSATQAGGQFYGMTEKMGQTAAGKWSTLLGLAGDKLYQLYGIIEPLVIPAMTVLEWIIGLVGKGIDALASAIGWVSEFMQKHVTVVTVLGVALGILATSMFLVTLQSKAMVLWAGIVTTAKWAWAAAQNGLNLALLACPMTWIIAAIIGLIAVIGYVCYKVQGWGTLWDGIVGFMKYSFLAFVESVKLYFNTMINGIMIGLDKIKLGWYKFKEAVGLGDSAENQAAIARINTDIENRQQAILEGAKRVADNAAKAKASLDGIHLKWDSERSLGDVTAKLKTSLGIASPSLPGMSGELATNTAGTGGGTSGSTTGAGAVSGIATGGQRSSTIHITLGSLVDKLIFEGGYEGSRDDMQRELENRLIQLLQMASTAR
ncbi:tape measure protein [Alistipes ihumii]|uniref:tape measure protein n=1 Tax=Alistipes TaxID=239759 RepID=UPI002055EFF4|nr:tape measure protein [Alistipes ihumii]DAJ82515.1 MAG TPA: tail tape measure protein [Caudoviricetes sp.]